MLSLACAMVMTVSTGPVLDEDADLPAIDLTVSLESMSREQLKREYRRVEEARPGIGGPIAMMGIGGGLGLICAAALASAAGSFGGIGSSFTERNPSGYFFVTIGVISAAFIMTGFWLIWTRKDDRSALGARMDAINERLDQLDQTDSYQRKLPRREREPVPAQL